MVKLRYQRTFIDAEHEDVDAAQLFQSGVRCVRL